MYISLEGLQTGEWKEKFLVVSTRFFFMATEFSYQDWCGNTQLVATLPPAALL